MKAHPFKQKQNPVWEITVKFWSGNQVQLLVKAPANSNLINLIYGKDATSPLVEGILCILEKYQEPIENVASVSIAVVITKTKPPEKMGVIKPFVKHAPEPSNEN